MKMQVLSGVLIAVGFGSGAGATEVLPPSLRACMKEPDSLRRLTCFDNESARLDRESAQPAAQSAPAARPVEAAPARPPVAAAPAPSAEEKFGYRGNLARADIDKQKAAEEQFEELNAKVAEVGTQPHGELIVTLDNGQVWQQKPGDRAMRIRVGDQVTIKRAVLGSFLLTSTATKGSIRVARVK